MDYNGSKKDMLKALSKKLMGMEVDSYKNRKSMKKAKKEKKPEVSMVEVEVTKSEPMEGKEQYDEAFKKEMREYFGSGSKSDKKPAREVVVTGNSQMPKPVMSKKKRRSRKSKMM